jgi:hypothetical protein
MPIAAAILATMHGVLSAVVSVMNPTQVQLVRNVLLAISGGHPTTA